MPLSKQDNEKNFTNSKQRIINIISFISHIGTIKGYVIFLELSMNGTCNNNPTKYVKGYPTRFVKSCKYYAWGSDGPSV